MIKLQIQQNSTKDIIIDTLIISLQNKTVIIQGLPETIELPDDAIELIKNYIESHASYIPKIVSAEKDTENGKQSISIEKQDIL